VQAFALLSLEFQVARQRLGKTLAGFGLTYTAFAADYKYLAGEGYLWVVQVAFQRRKI
jgi:hypothetical protein